VAGGGIARGYWNQGLDPAGAFGRQLPDAPGRRFLRTGDLGFLIDGELYITGRHQDMIIVRGENHYPQDLEQAAETACPVLRPSAAAAFTVEEDGAQRLVLCAELRSYRGAGTAAQIGAVLREHLLRQHGIELHTLVVLKRGGVLKTTSGKVRRQACRHALRSGTLPVYDRADLAPAAVAALPPAARLRAAGQAAGARLLADALLGLMAGPLGPGSQPSAADRPLVELGMNSLGTLELCHAVRAAYGVDLNLAELLGGATVAGLAARIAGSLAAGPPAAPPPGGPAGPDPGPAGPDPGPDTPGWAPLTWRQRAIWYEQQLDPAAAAYHLARAVLLRGVQPERLDQALAGLARRHPALRTRFAVHEGIPCCRVTPDGPGLTHLDASGLTRENLASLLREEAQRPFDLAEQPLARLTVARRGPDVVLQLVAHHLVADFWSLVVLLRDLAAGYSAGPDAGQPAGGTHVQLAAAEDRWLASAAGQRSRQFWLA
jgi:nonribosomal peptide synthetase protein BlmVI